MRQVEKMAIDGLTPVEAYLRVDGENKCVLEKNSFSQNYSVIAIDPVLELVFQEDVFSSINKLTKETKQYHCNDPLKEMEKYVLGENKSSHEEILPFDSGAIGYVGYDVARCYETIGEIPFDELDIPDLLFFVFETFIIFDYETSQLLIVVDNTYSHRSEKEMAQVMEMIKTQLMLPSKEESKKIEAFNLSFTSNVTKHDYETIVEEAKELITKGDLFQVVPSQRLKTQFNRQPFEYYCRLRENNPSSYLYYLDFDSEFKVVGSSPESLVKVDGQTVITNPIAGTRKRGKTKEEDDQLAKDLLSDEKELAEHRMLVDLGRNDLGKIAEIGSVSVPTYMVIGKYQHVIHIISIVEATRRDEITAMDALKATLPAGTVSGAPKIRAMNRIYEWEKVKRGIYAGAIGYLSKADDADFAIGIRTMVIKSGYGYVQAGAGIVYDSNPTTEYFETLQKAKALLEVG